MTLVYILLAAYLFCLYLAYRGAASMDDDPYTPPEQDLSDVTIDDLINQR
jgi:hypothetical protein